MSQTRASFHYINIVISMGPGQQASTQLHHHITQNYSQPFHLQWHKNISPIFL